MPDIHPTGTFNDCEIIDHGFAESGQKKSLYFWIKVRTPQSDEFGNVFGNFYLTGAAAEQTIDKIAAMGFNGDDLQELADGTKLRGNVVQITVEHDEYNDNVRARIGFVNPNNAIVGPTHDEKAAQNAKQFNALWKKRRPTAPSADDEVPF